MGPSSWAIQETVLREMIWIPSRMATKIFIPTNRTELPKAAARPQITRSRLSYQTRYGS